MAVNLIDSQDITITQTDNDITLNVQKDSAVSTSSTKPVENQAITNYVNDAYDIIDILKHNKTNSPEGTNADCLMINDTTTQGVNLTYNPNNAPETNKMVMWWCYTTINTGENAYWTYIVLAITLDDNKFWMNAYHNAINSWIGWQQL